MKRSYKDAFRTRSSVRPSFKDKINELTFELFLLIFSFCSPATLHRCRRVCKFWQNLLTDETIWAHSHQQFLPRIPLPPVAVISHSKLLGLLLGRGCQLCGRPKIRKVAWKWLVRACATCLGTNSKSLVQLLEVRGSEHGGPDRCLLYEEGEHLARMRVYWWPTIEDRQARWHDVDENQKSWLNAQMAVHDAGNQFAEKIRRVLYIRNLEAREDRQRAIMRRKQDIIERAEMLVPSMSSEMVELSGCFRHFARMKKPLDECWPECARLLLEERDDLVEFLSIHDTFDLRFEKIFEEMDAVEDMEEQGLLQHQRFVQLENEYDEVMEEYLQIYD